MTRLDSVLTAIKDSGLDALLVTTPVNTYYLSGFRAVAYTRPIYVLVCDEPVLIVPELELEHARDKSIIKEIEQYSDDDFGSEKNQSPQVAALNKILAVSRRKGLDAEKLGFEQAAISYAAFEQLSNLFPGKLEATPPIVEKMRVIKDAEEIELIHAGCRLADLGMDVEITKTVPGVTELDLMLEAAAAMTREGMIRYPDYTLDAGARPITGLKTVLPHSIPTGNKVRSGDVVIHGTGCMCEGYHSENERTLIVGRPNNDQRKFFNLMLLSQQRAFDSIKPGIRCRLVDLAAREVVREAGYSRYFLHRTGHSMGLGIHETPFFAPTDETILEPGMIMTVEPGIYVPGLGGFRHSDTILVTETGFEFLTTTPRKLESLIV
ncbi:MAG: Xaa-Pro peptidase family protein [bacterium]|jgi:Xaa-Pro dipeptidase|nr:Xaa-Pro peptidase family protein [bacterium]